MMHRLREALRQGSFAAPMGSGGGVVEVDEIFTASKRATLKASAKAI